MKKSDNVVLGWFCAILGVLLAIKPLKVFLPALFSIRGLPFLLRQKMAFQTLAGSQRVRLVLCAALVVFGVILILKNRTVPEYWQQNPCKRVKKVCRRIRREDSIDVLRRITDSTSEATICQAAEERKKILLQKQLAGQNQEELKKSLQKLVDDSFRDGKWSDLLDLAEAVYPKLVYDLIWVKMATYFQPDQYSQSKIAFIVDIAKRYPDILNYNRQKLGKWAHEDRSSHADKPGGFHTDNTQYYDWIRYPDGRTVPNTRGRRQHTDTRGSYSDCHEDHHQDSTNHTDNAHNERLVPFQPYIPNE